MPDDVLLSVRDLHTWFELRRWGFVRVGFVRAVDGITFDLRRGEALAVVGGSGGGKSTLAKTILGLHLPPPGEIVFDGRTVQRQGKPRWFHSPGGFVEAGPTGSLS